MPDVFDQIDSMPKQGDIFDQAHAQMNAPQKSEWSDEPGPGLSYSTDQRQFRPGVANDSLHQAGNAFKQGTANLLLKGATHLGNLVHDNLSGLTATGSNLTSVNPDATAEQLRAQQSLPPASAEQQVQAQRNIGAATAATYPFDPSSMAGKVGSMGAQVLPAMAASAMGQLELVPPIMAAQAAEGGQEHIEDLRAQGIPVSHQQATANVLGNAALGYATGQLAPGGAASKAILGQVPEAVSPLINAGVRTGVSALTTAAEGGTYQAGSNVINQATGAQTPEEKAKPFLSQVGEGVPEAAVQGGLLGAGTQAVHEGLSAVSPKPPHDQTAQTPNQDRGQDNVSQVEGVHNPENRPAGAATEVAPLANQSDTSPVQGEQPYDFAALRQRMEEDHWRDQSEPEHTESHGDVFDQIKPTFEAPGETAPQDQAEVQALEKRMSERRMTQTPVGDERRVEDRRLPEHTFQTPEESAPNLLAQIREDHTAREESSAAAPAEGNVFKRLGHNEAAADTGTEQFVKQDVVPTIKNISEGLKDAMIGVRNTFGLQEGRGAEETKGVMKERGAELAQRTDQIADRFRDAEKTVDKLPEPEQLAITHAAEMGIKQTDPKMQDLADSIRDMYDDRLAQIQKRDPEFKGIEDYMAHDWQDPKSAAPVIEEALKKRPIAGSGGFRKQRVFMTQEEGIAAGLEPKSTNPVTQMRAKLHSMDRWITAHDAKESLTTSGLVKDIPASTNGKPPRIPDGYAKVDDPLFHNKIVPEAVASVLNNVLKPGIAGDPHFGPAFRGLRTAANMMNEAQLSLSGMHAVTSSINSALSEFALGIKQAVEGKPAEGAKRMGMGLTGVGPAVRDYFGGTKMLKEWLHPGTTDPETSLIVNAMKKQGGRALMESYDRSGMSDKMMDAFRNGNPLGGILRAPFAAIEQSAKPIMKYMVPRLKMGAFMQAAQAALADHPNATAEELSNHMGDAWRSIDNRFGQMVHDNRFWTQTMRHLSHMAFRSVGWNYGTLDEMGGAALDTIQAGKDLAAGAKPEFTHRMAYSVALPALVGIWGSVLGYAMTGKAPQSIKDMYYVPTGNTDKDGRDVRIALPTYMRDVISAKHDPFGTVGSKLHPLIGSTLSLLNNKDYMGNKVYNEDDNGMKIVGDVAKHYGKSFTPINLQQYLSNKQSGSDQGSLVRTQMGISNAPKWVSTSDAEQEAYKLIDEKNNKVGGRTAEAETLRQHESDWSSRIRKGDTQSVIQEMKADPQMSEERGKNVFKRAREKQGLPGLVGDAQLGAADLFKVWSKASDQEKAESKDVLMKRLDSESGRSANMSPDDRTAWIKLYHAVKGE